MTRKPAKKRVYAGKPWDGSTRHPSSRQELPDRVGWYWVRGFPGDDERRLYWADGAFRCGLTCQMWWSWRPCE